jgi:hypothetical protein
MLDPKGNHPDAVGRAADLSELLRNES